jgi:hypothetical protein
VPIEPPLNRQDALYQCKPSILTWTKTLGPYILNIVDSDTEPIWTSPNTDADDKLIVVPSGSSAAWIVDVPAGRNVTVWVKDGEGHVAGTWPRVIGPGSGGCLGSGLVVQA